MNILSEINEIKSQNESKINDKLKKLTSILGTQNLNMLSNDIPSIDEIKTKLEVISNYIKDNSVAVYGSSTIKIDQRLSIVESELYKKVAYKEMMRRFDEKANIDDINNIIVGIHKELDSKMDLPKPEIIKIETKKKKNNSFV